MIEIENGKEYKGMKNEIHKEKERNAERNTQRKRKKCRTKYTKKKKGKDALKQ